MVESWHNLIRNLNGEYRILGFSSSEEKQRFSEKNRRFIIDDSGQVDINGVVYDVILLESEISTQNFADLSARNPISSNPIQVVSVSVTALENLADKKERTSRG